MKIECCFDENFKNKKSNHQNYEISHNLNFQLARLIHNLQIILLNILSLLLYKINRIQ
jgi:hypothetical protein